MRPLRRPMEREGPVLRIWLRARSESEARRPGEVGVRTPTYPSATRLQPLEHILPVSIDNAQTDR